MYLWVILGILGLFAFIGVLMWYFDEEIWTPYGKIFAIRNFNKTGKILFCIVVTPFTILPTITVLLVVALVTAFEYIVYGIRWLFAEDRKQLHKDWFEPDEHHYDFRW